jgi:hypothetical protein
LNPNPELKSSLKFMGLREKLDKFQEKFMRGLLGQVVAAIQRASVSIISPFCTIFQGLEAALDHAAPAPVQQRRSGNSTSHCGVQCREGPAFSSMKNVDHRAAVSMP